MGISNMKKSIHFIKSKIQSGFGRDVFITTCGQSIIVLLTFLNNKIISSRFGPSTYTEYSLIQKTASVIGYIMVLSMGIVLPKYLAINHDNKKWKDRYFLAAFLLVSFTSLFITVICLLNRDVFAQLIFNDIRYENYVFLTLILAIKLTFTTFLYSYYRGIDDFIKYSISQIILSFLGIFIVIFSKNIIIMVTIQSVVLGGISFIILLSFFYKILKEDKRTIYHLFNEIKTLTCAGIPRVPGEVVLFSFTTIPLIIINGKIGLEQAAAYSIAFGINSAASPLFRYVGLALLPYASREISKGNLKGVNRKLKSLAFIYIGISALAILIVQLFPNLVINILYSKEYLQFSPTVKIITLSLLPNSLYLLLRNPIDAASDKPINTINLIVSFSIMCALIYISNTNIEFAWCIFLGYTILGILSIISWLFLKKEKNIERVTID